MVAVETDPHWWKIWRNRRYVVSIMIALGFVNLYAMRVNLNVAIVVMTGTSEENLTPEFDWTPQMRGYLLSSFFYSYVFMQLPSGLIVKRFSPHFLFTLAILVSSVLNGLMPFVAHHFYLLIIFRVCIGFFQGFSVPVAVQFLALWGPPLERTRMGGIITSGAALGTIISLAASAIIGDHFGWQWIFYVFSVFGLLWCILWTVFIRSNPEDDKYVSKLELEYIKNSIGRRSGSELPIPWNSILKSVPFWSLCVGNFAYGWGYQTMLAQLPKFLKEVSGFDLTKNGLYLSIPYISTIVVTIIAGYTVDLFLIKGFGKTCIRKCYLGIGFAVQCVFLIIAAYIVIPEVNIACIAISVSFGAVTYATVGLNPLDLAPNLSAVIAGASSTFGTLPGIVSPILAGYIVVADETDTDSLKAQWQIIFFITAGIYIFGIVVFTIFGTGERQSWDNGTLLTSNVIENTDLSRKSKTVSEEERS